MGWEHTTEEINYVPRKDGYNWQIKNDGRTFAINSFSSILDMAAEEGWEPISIVADNWITNDDGSKFVTSYLVFYRRPRTTPLEIVVGKKPFFIEIKNEDEHPF